jgi:molybdopterin converting factor small subunit
MVIKFFGPFDKVLGKEAQLELEKAITLKALIGRLASRYSDFVPYSAHKTDADLMAQMMFVKDGKPLKLDDLVDDGDTVQVVLPVTGG